MNVVEKGTTNGVITDFNGQFTLNVAQGKTLVFSYAVSYTHLANILLDTISFPPENMCSKSVPQTRKDIGPIK